GVSASVRVLFVNRARQHLNGTHEQVAIFRGRPFEVEHEMLELVRHGVEGRGQFSDLGAAPELDSLREVAASDGAAGGSENLQRIGDAAGGKNADAHTQQNGQHRQQAGAALHLVHASVRLVTWLLHDHGPVQVADRAVGAEHLSALLALGDAEFPGGRHQLRPAALLQEVAHDLRVGQVLASGVVGGGAGHQPALTVHHIRCEPAAIDFLQTADQKLQVFHRSNHSQKASAIHHRSADQHYGAGRLSTTHDQCLAAVGAAFTGGVIGAYQVALQKRVGSDAARGNSLGLRVHQGGVSQVSGRRNKVLQQGAQFGRLYVLRGNVPAAGYLQGGRQVGQHHAQRFLVLRDVVGQGAGHRILQQTLVSDQAFPVDCLHVLRIKIHRHHADEREHTQDDVQNRNA